MSTRIRLAPSDCVCYRSRYPGHRTGPPHHWSPGNTPTQNHSQRLRFADGLAFNTKKNDSSGFGTDNSRVALTSHCQNIRYS